MPSALPGKRLLQYSLLRHQHRRPRLRGRAGDPHLELRRCHPPRHHAGLGARPVCTLLVVTMDEEAPTLLPLDLVALESAPEHLARRIREQGTILYERP